VDLFFSFGYRKLEFQYLMQALLFIFLSVHGNAMILSSFCSNHVFFIYTFFIFIGFRDLWLSGLVYMSLI
jgi:hypothetical protein